MSGEKETDADLSTLNVDHVGVVVESLEAGMTALERLFGVVADEKIDLREVLGIRVAFYRFANVSIELIEPSDEGSRRRRLEGANARIEHVCFRVTDINATAALLRGRGAVWTSAKPTDANGRLVLYTRPESSGDIVYQLLQWK